MKQYVVRLGELAGAGFVVGASEYVVQHGFELSSAGLRGLAVAGGMAAWGVLVKKVGDKNRPSAVK